MKAKDARRVLVVGPARSGTSWVGKALGRTVGASYVHEPDNMANKPFAVRALRGIGMLPILAPDAHAPDYERLWTAAFVPRPGRLLEQVIYRLRFRIARRLMKGMTQAQILVRLSRNRQGMRLSLATATSVPARPGSEAETVVAKTVHAVLSLEWIVRRFSPSVLVVLRHPFSIVASRRDMGWVAGDGGTAGPPERLELARKLGIEALGSDATALQRAAWQVGTVICELEAKAAANPDWLVVTHESLCESPIERFREISKRLGLTWSAEAESFVRGSNRPGKGYEVNRIAEQEIGKWRTLLTPDEIRQVSAVLARFPIRTYEINEADGPARVRGGEGRVGGGGASS